MDKGNEKFYLKTYDVGLAAGMDVSDFIDPALHHKKEDKCYFYQSLILKLKKFSSNKEKHLKKCVFIVCLNAIKVLLCCVILK